MKRKNYPGLLNLLASLVTLFYLGLGDAKAQSHISDDINFDYQCNYSNVILSSDQFQWEIDCFASGGTSVAFNYYRRIDALFYEVATGQLVKEVNLTEHQIGNFTVPRVQLLGSYDALVDEETLMGLPDGQIQMDLKFTYSRGTVPQSINTDVHVSIPNYPLFIVQLAEGGEEELWPITEVLCFEYFNCPEVTVTTGSGQVDGQKVFAILDPEMTDPMYEWEIDNEDQNVDRDYVYKICGLHNYSVTVTDQETGCQTTDNTDIFHPCDTHNGNDGPEPCELESFTVQMRIDSVGGLSVIVPPNIPGSIGFRLVIIYNDPSCCADPVGPAAVSVFPIKTNKIALPTRGCYSWKIEAICPNGTTGSSIGKFCSTGPSIISNDTSESDSRNQNQIEPAQINVYPNPAADFVTIDLQQELNNVAIQLIDGQGKIVKRKKEDLVQECVLDISNISPGIYFLKIQDDGVLHEVRRVVIVD